MTFGEVTVRLPVVLAMALSAATPAWAQVDRTPQQEEEAKPPAKLEIGTLLGAPRPEGFVVEDLRIPESKAPSAFRQTYKAPFKPFGRPAVPLARYERNVGEDEFSAPPIDLLVEKLVEQYGDKLRGKRLAVHAFSYVIEQNVNKPQGLMVIPLDAGAVVFAVIASAAGTAIMSGRGIDLRLAVKIDAELDGTRIESAERGMDLNQVGAPARVTRYAIEKFVYRLNNAAAEAEQVKKEEASKD